MELHLLAEELVDHHIVALQDLEELHGNLVVLEAELVMHHLAQVLDMV